MPWYKTEYIIPPLNSEITTFKDGVKETKKYTAEEIFNGKGGLNKNFPKFWTRNKDITIIPTDSETGLDRTTTFQEEILQPKIVDGMAPPKGPEVKGEGAWDQR